MMRLKIIAMDVDVISMTTAVDRVLELSRAESGSYVCVANVHMCMEAFDSPSFRRVVNAADMVIPDGKPLYLAQKILGQRGVEQVRGQDIMTELCAISGRQKLNIGFYGGSSNSVLELVKSNLNSLFPDIRVTYAFSPPFRALTDIEVVKVVKEINSSKVDVLFVGIGCPKQETWMSEHTNDLDCVMLGVGAAFDFVAGNKTHAPRWVQNIGLEWLFRLCSEPKRLWRRYLKQNPRFVWYFLKQLIELKRN